MKRSVRASTLLLALCATSMLAACSSTTSTSRPTEKQIREHADYWQRAETTSALYLTGPKAQYVLNGDIASCVAEVKELVRLGSIRDAEPPRNIGMEPGLARGWTSPTRNGPLYTEYRDFSDFDGCMRSKGWERTNFVRPAQANAAASNYSQTILGNRIGGTYEYSHRETKTDFNN